MTLNIKYLQTRSLRPRSVTNLREADSNPNPGNFQKMHIDAITFSPEI